MITGHAYGRGHVLLLFTNNVEDLVIMSPSVYEIQSSGIFTGGIRALMPLSNVHTCITMCSSYVNC